MTRKFHEACIAIAIVIRRCNFSFKSWLLVYTMSSYHYEENLYLANLLTNNINASDN